MLGCTQLNFEQKRAKIDDFTTLRKRVFTNMAKKCLIRQKCDFSMFSGFLRRQMKSDMVGMPNQDYLRNKGYVRLYSVEF